MRYTEVKGRPVSAMSLGTVQLGMNYGIANKEGKPDREKSFAILTAALEAGVSALDTARAYGESEEVLGDFFKANPKSKDIFYITSKLSSGLPAGSTEQDVEKTLFKSIETSLSALGRAKVNCLLLHNASDMYIHGKIVANTLRRLVSMGLADMAGVSVYHPEEAELLLEDDIYQAVQLPINVFDQRFIKSGILDRLSGRGIHIFARSVFFQGLFFLDPENLSDPDLVQHAVPHLRTLRLLSEKAEMSIAQFAVSFLQSLPGITSLVLGADNPEQVKQNAALFEAHHNKENSDKKYPIAQNIYQLAQEAFEEINYPEIMTVLSRPRTDPVHL